MEQSLWDIKPFNDKLLQVYGKDLLGRPNYRVVWAPNQFEKRKGKMNIYAGSIFIREESGVHEVPKYPWIGERWVLEKLMTHAQVPDELSPGGNTTYEPIYVFQDAERNPLPVIWDIIEYLVSHLINNEPAKTTEKDAYEEDAKQFDREVEENFAAMGGEEK